MATHNYQTEHTSHQPGADQKRINEIITDWKVQGFQLVHQTLDGGQGFAHPGGKIAQIQHRGNEIRYAILSKEEAPKAWKTACEVLGWPL